MGHPLSFSRMTGAVILLKIGCPECFLVVLDDQMTANFEHCNVQASACTMW